MLGLGKAFWCCSKSRHFGDPRDHPWSRLAHLATHVHLYLIKPHISRKNGKSLLKLRLGAQDRQPNSVVCIYATSRNSNVPYTTNARARTQCELISAILSIPKSTGIRLHREANMCQSLFTRPNPEKWLFSPAQSSQSLPTCLISNMETNWWGADLLT